MKQTMINLINSDKNLSLEKLLTPATIIWGEKDRTTPLWMGHDLHRKIRNSNLKVIKNAGHSPQFSHLEEVYAIIRAAIS